MGENKKDTEKQINIYLLVLLRLVPIQNAKQNFIHNEHTNNNNKIIKLSLQIAGLDI